MLLVEPRVQKSHKCMKEQRLQLSQDAKTPGPRLLGLLTILSKSMETM